MKFKLLVAIIGFIPAMVMAQAQTPATPPPVTYSPPPSNTANSNKAIIPGTAPAPAANQELVVVKTKERPTKANSLTEDQLRGVVLGKPQ